MNQRAKPKRNAAFTVLELLIVVLILLIMIGFMLPGTIDNRVSATRIHCVNNLKQAGLGFRVWAGDHQDHYPMQVLTNESGALLSASNSNFYRYFQVMSNELNTPKILVCPEDKTPSAATNFTSDFNSTKISYFVGLDADETQPNMFLAGDPHITNGLPLTNGIMFATTNPPANWTARLHKGKGNIALADGSVQQLSTARLRDAIAHTGTNVNRLLFP